MDDERAPLDGGPIEGPVLDPSSVQRLRALQLAVGEAENVFESLRTVFSADAQRHLGRLQQNADGADPKAISDTAHALKGAALTVGAERVAMGCRRLETWAKRPPPRPVESLREGIAVVAVELEDAIAALGELA